jgi:hypothetical protein
MVRNASDFLSSSQPGSSQPQRDDPEMMERAFWQSTPTALQELRQGSEKEKEWHRVAREFLSSSYRLAPAECTPGVHHTDTYTMIRYSIGPSGQTRGPLSPLDPAIEAHSPDMGL